MSTAVDAAIVAVLQADATLQGLAPGGVWPDLAPEQAATPYVIVTLEDHSDVPEQVGTAFEQATYLVSVIDKHTDAAAANAAYNRAHAVLTGGPLTVPGYHVMDLRRLSRTRGAERDGPIVWRFVGGLYRVEADPS